MISVVVPCFNAGAYIENTLMSILGQQVPADLEVIVVDDGSTDQSAAIIQSVSDNRLRYLFQQNKGVSVARNVGMAAARGSFIIFFDADDLMADHFLTERLVPLLDNPVLGYACGLVLTFPLHSHAVLGCHVDVANKLLTYQEGYSSCPSNYLFRTAVLKQHGICFHEGLSSTADRFFLLQVSQVAIGILVDNAPLLYRVSPGSMSNNLCKRLIEDNEAYLLALEHAGLIPEKLKQVFLFKIFYILGLGYIKTGVLYKGLRYLIKSMLCDPSSFVKQMSKYVWNFRFC